jgi:hypothetical protein
MEDTTKVKSMLSLAHEIMDEVNGLDTRVNTYESARSQDADGEQRFNEGRYGRELLERIDAASAALTALRMRVNLQLEGRDNARAKQLDRILGIAEDVEDVAIMLEITDRAAARERDEGGGS